MPTDDSIPEMSKLTKILYRKTAKVKFLGVVIGRFVKLPLTSQTLLPQHVSLCETVKRVRF